MVFVKLALLLGAERLMVARILPGTRVIGFGRDVTWHSIDDDHWCTTPTTSANVRSSFSADSVGNVFGTWELRLIGFLKVTL